MTGREPGRGDVLISGGSIFRVAPTIDPAAAGADQVVDATGLHVCPGLVDVHMHLSCASDQPERAEDALCGVALAAGITTAALAPEEDGALCPVYHGNVPAKAAKMRTFHLESLTDAEAAARMTAAARSGETLVCHIHGVDSLRRTLRLRTEATDGPCRMALAHLTGCGDVVDEIAAAGCPVILGACSLRGAGSAYALATRLRRAGVLVALTADYPATRPHHLPICAGLCVRAGMPAADALRAVTADAARLLGLQNVCGAIAPGLRADLTLYDGDPLRLTSACVAVYSGGEPVRQR